MSEQYIEVDKNNNLIGSRPRNYFYTGKHIHRSTYLILFNSKKQILVQKRPSNKKWYPNLYTFAVAKTVRKNESYQDSIKKGMKENIGISVPIKYLFLIFFSDKSDRAFRAVFLGKSDKDVNLKRNNRIKWVRVDVLKKDIKNHPEKYAPPFIECMKKYFSEFYRQT